MFPDTCLRRGRFLRFDFGWRVKELQAFEGAFVPRRLPEIEVCSAIEGPEDHSSGGLPYDSKDDGRAHRTRLTPFLVTCRGVIMTPLFEYNVY